MFKIIRCVYSPKVDWVKTRAVRPFWRVYWHQETAGNITSESMSLVGRAGHMVAIPPGISVTQKTDKSFPQLWFHVDVEPPFDKYPSLVEFEVPEHLELKLHRLVSLIQSGMKFCAEAEVIQSYYLGWFFSSLDKDKLSQQDQYSPQVSKTLKLLKENTQSGVSLEYLSEKLKLSTRALTAKFSEEIGVTPHTYLTELRIKDGAQLLVDTDLSIEQISDRCGFCDRSHFSRVFKKFYSQGPASFRLNQSG